MQITGKIHRIDETQTFGESFNKREFIVFVENESNIDWSDYLKLELIQDKCSLLDSLNVGDKIACDINLRGRLWTNKDNKEVCFNTLQAWRIEKLESASTQQQNSVSAPQEAPKEDEETDQLPF